MIDAFLTLFAAATAFLSARPLALVAAKGIRRLRRKIETVLEHRARPSPVQWAQTLLFLSGAMRSGATLEDALRLLSAQAPPALR